MPRTKTPTEYIEDGRKRRDTFKTKSEALLRKSRHLAALCAVPVAVVVCADPQTGGGAPTVMQTEAVVLDRYRAILADKRGEHTHIRYLEDALKKEKTRLARLRKSGPGGIEPPHGEMSLMSLGELHRLFVSVEAALAAAEERRRALGLPLPVDAVVAPRRDSGPWTVAGGSRSDGGFLQMMQQGQGVADINHGLPDQPMIGQGNGGADINLHGLLDQPMIGQGYGGVDINHGLLDQPMIGQGDGGAGINHGLLDQRMIGQGDCGAGINHGLLDQPMIGQGDVGAGISHALLDLHPMIGQGDCGAGINHGLLDQPMIGQGDCGVDINHGLHDLQPMIGQAGDCGGMIPFPLGLYNGINMPGAVHLGGYQVPLTGFAPPGACGFQPYHDNTQSWNFQYDEGTCSSWMVAPSPASNGGDYNNGSVVHIARYPYMHTSGNPPAAENQSQFIGTLADVLVVGAGDQFTGSNFTNLGASGNGMKKYQNAAYDSTLLGYMHTRGNPPAAENENPADEFIGSNFTSTPTESFLHVRASGNGGTQPAAENPDHQFTGSNFTNLGASGNRMEYQNAAYDSMLFGSSSHDI